MRQKMSKALMAGLDAVSALETRLSSQKQPSRTHSPKTANNNPIQEEI